jgi:membrane associated rhomboid family serine protease
MIESQDRVEQFRAEIAEMKLRDPATSRERIWLGLGIALMAVGAALALASYLISHQSTSSLVQNDAVTLGLAGIAAAVIGAALFLRYSLASFLRFWLARLIYEQKAQTDRMLEK